MAELTRSPGQKPGTGGQWRYFAQRFDGTGNLGDFIDLNLPLQEVEISEVLSGHNGMSVTISPELARLKGSDGRPVFDEWGACLWAESPNGEVFGGIIERSSFDGETWGIECLDISGALIEAPFIGNAAFSDADPLDIFRWFWVWFQSRPGYNYGVTADSTSSPVRRGTYAEYVQGQDFDPEYGNDPSPYVDPEVPVGPSSFATNQAWLDKAIKKCKKLDNGWKNADIVNALTNWINTPSGDPIFVTPLHEKIVKRAIKMLGQPPNPPGTPLDASPTVSNPKNYQVDYALKYNWWDTTDISKVQEDLSAATPFSWHMIHRWSDDSDDALLQHHIRLGYKTLGRTITDLRFVVGENIHEVPSVERDGEEYASSVFVLGNGEGAAMAHGSAFRPTPGKPNRTVVVTDQTLTTNAACDQRAAEELAARNQLEDVTELILVEHPHAPLGAVQLGDEILLEGDTGWLDVSMWVRVVGRSFRPDEGNQVTLSVVRTDRLS